MKKKLLTPKTCLICPKPLGKKRTVFCSQEHAYLSGKGTMGETAEDILKRLNLSSRKRLMK